ncbi:MAG TPA: LysM domain-containing protein [Thermoanaerobaculia bacterium]|nr:LysM domain-containing protein [Thermoanaerobaculia bacterium]
MNRLLLTLALLPLLAAPGARAADVPPRNLHLVGDHWTAWDPPVPPPDAQVHVIEPGDTLWDLAARFSGDPYLWPQLWERNQYILDAHWIYPGDPLVVGVEVVPVDTLAELVDVVEEPVEPLANGEDDAGGGDGIRSAAEAASGPQPLGTESDIYCTGYVGELEREFPHTIVGSEYEALTPFIEIAGRAGAGDRGLRFGGTTVKYGLMSGDVVYLDGGRGAGLAPGEVFTVVSPEDTVRHPVRDEVVGRFYRYRGRVRVLSVQQDTAIAEIVHTCDPIFVGSLLEPFEPEPVPLGRRTAMRPVNLPAPEEALTDAAVILRAEDDIFTLAEDSLVYIDRGADAAVVPGDVYTIYRLNKPGLPPIVLGELAVLSVHDRSSVARIVRSRYTVYVGDRLEEKQ